MSNQRATEECASMETVGATESTSALVGFVTLWTLTIILVTLVAWLIVRRLR